VKPSDLGLSFPNWLPYQEPVALAAHGSHKPFVLIEAPTGSGKTAIAAAMAHLGQVNAVYTCLSRGLQDQVIRDFPFAVELKGRSNYPCQLLPNAFPEVSAEHCQHRKDAPCSKLDSCEYRAAKRRALSAKLAVLNLAYFLEETNHVGAFRNTKLLILDEGDEVESALLSHIEVSISRKRLERLGIMDLPQYKTKPESWRVWCDGVLSVAQPILNRLIVEQEERQTYDFARQREIIALGRLCSRLSFFAKGPVDNWVYDPEDNRVVFKPVWASGFATSRLFQWVKGKTLAMSATLQPRQWAADLGVEFSSAMALDIPSRFPIDRRPIYYTPAFNMTHKTSDQEWPKMLRWVDGVIDRYPQQRGLIHSVSYALGNYILKGSRHRSQLVGHTPVTRDEVVRAFILGEYPNDAVLVSPALSRGVDLKYDLCRFIIVPKVPWLNRGDKQVAQRLYGGGKRGQEWYMAATSRTLVQASGRGMRAADDRCDTWLGDSQFERLLQDGRWCFPKWWLEALVRA